MAQGEQQEPATRPMSGRVRSEAVNVITEARPSYDDEFRARRKRYVLMMATRVPCLVLGAVFYRTPWLAVLIIAISIPLPWMAVLIANDGPARKKSRKAPGLVNTQPVLTSGETTVIEAADDPAAASGADRDHPAAG